MHPNQKLETIWLYEHQKTMEKANMLEHGNYYNPVNAPGKLNNPTRWEKLWISFFVNSWRCDCVKVLWAWS